MNPAPTPPLPDFAALFDAAPGKFLLLLPDAPRFTIRTANNAYLQATRRTMAELTGRSVFDAFPDHPERGHLDALRDSLNYVVRHRTAHELPPLKYDIPLLGGKGFDERYWKVKNVPLLAADGSLTYIMQSVEDITRRLRAELDRNRFFAVATDLLVKTDFDGRLLEVSPASEAVLGWPPQEMTGRPWLEFVDPRDLGSSAQMLETVRGAAAELHYFENRLRCKDGSYRYLRWNIQPETDERVIYWAATDVTQAHRLQAVTEGQKRALEMSVQGAALPTILDQLLRTLEGNLRAGARSSMLLMNAAGDRLLAGAAPSLPAILVPGPKGWPIGPDRGSCGAAAASGEIYAAYDIATDPAWKNLRQYALPHGLRSCWSAPVHSSSGDVIGTFALYFDRPTRLSGEKLQLLEIVGRTAGTVIERERNALAKRRVEQELIRARNAAEAGSRAKSEFLATMSHEIRTPLNVVTGTADLLSRENHLTGHQAELVTTLQSAADSLLVLLNDVLDLSRIEAGGMGLEHTPFRLGELVKGVTDMLALRAQQRDITLRVEGSVGESDTFVGDPGRLRQVLLNLCGNAVKFTPRGGRVTVGSAREETDDPLTARIRLTVADTGIGIAPEHQQSIFHKFTQADNSINREFGGTGLGLSITRELVALMGGSIEVESTPNHGSTFTVFLPLRRAVDIPAPPTASEAEAPAAPPQPSNEQPRVLLVEDFEPNAIVAGHYLRRFGYAFDVATDGTEAVAKGTTGQYAVILMDLRMPVMDGYAAAARIRQHEQETTARQRTPIIALTAHATVEDRERCLAVGMDDYLSKPFRAVDLQRKLEQFVGGGQEEALPR